MPWHGMACLHACPVFPFASIVVVAPRRLVRENKVEAWNLPLGVGEPPACLPACHRLSLPSRHPQPSALLCNCLRMPRCIPEFQACSFIAALLCFYLASPPLLQFPT